MILREIDPNRSIDAADATRTMGAQRLMAAALEPVEFMMIFALSVPINNTSEVNLPALWDLMLR